MIDFSLRLLLIFLSLKNACLLSFEKTSLETNFYKPSESSALNLEKKNYNQNIFLNNSGESFDDDFKHRYGQKMKSSYNKQNKFANGKKQSYNRNFKLNDKNMKKTHRNLSRPDQKHRNDESLELRKNRKSGSKNKAYHNIFMKDEYKKNHAIFW